MPNLRATMDEIRKIGPVLPGSLDAYHTVCGKPGCRCKDKDNPKRHGPYYRLSYSLAGRNSSMFVKQQDVERVRTMVSNYKRLRQLTVELALTSLESVKALGVAATTAGIPLDEPRHLCWLGHERHRVRPQPATEH